MLLGRGSLHGLGNLSEELDVGTSSLLGSLLLLDVLVHLAGKDQPVILPALYFIGFHKPPAEVIELPQEIKGVADVSPLVGQTVIRVAEALAINFIPLIPALIRVHVLVPAFFSWNHGLLPVNVLSVPVVVHGFTHVSPVLPASILPIPPLFLALSIVLRSKHEAASVGRQNT